jgi:hypothetical protein
LPTTNGINNSLEKPNIYNQQIISKISKEIEIPAKSDYYVKFSSSNLSLEEQHIDAYTKGLNNKILLSIAKSPNWIQRELTRQFKAINDSEEYAILLLNASKRITDELAFSIACSPLGTVPPVQVVEDNIVTLQKIDNWIEYADIKDYKHNSGDYYSTVQYKVLENGTEKLFEYPKDIYYWYVVHPKISHETCKYIYETFWRDYYFYHNDIGYPLLMEKIARIDFLWDCESYFQHKNRSWKWSMDNHPTAIEAISYWVGKTVPVQAIGTRPGQPNEIAHEHNGWCGELQRIAAAAQRTALIPSIGAYNVGEDHVWREYYERGWHENDNWWSDGGGAVDKPDVYEYGWGKNMSAVYAMKGDSSIYDVTSRYIHPEDRYTIQFVVTDNYLQPIDGVKVTVFVQGIKDITWIKKVIWDKIQEVWDNFPEIIKGKIFQYIFNKMKEKFEKIPNIIEGLTKTIWNYTNTDGECTFELGRGHGYLFIVQQGNVKKPWRLAKNNAIRFLTNPKDTKFRIIFPDLFQKVHRHAIKKVPPGECLFDISFNSSSYQLHKNYISKNVGIYRKKGKIDFFVLDEDNFKKYKHGEKFQCYNYSKCESESISFSTSKTDLFFIFRNRGRLTNTILDFSIQVKLNTNGNHVQIVNPDTNIFNESIFNIGDIINISGIASGNVDINIDNISKEIIPKKHLWYFLWNTSKKRPGDYLLTVDCGNVEDKKIITLIDEIPPNIQIIEPPNMAIIEKDIMTIAGDCWDYSGVNSVEVAIDNDEFQKATGAENWVIEWDIKSLEIGEHLIKIKAIDINKKQTIVKSSFIINETGHTWGPQINSYYHKPNNPINISNVIIYANVTKASPFNIKKVMLYCSYNNETESFTMYRYGDYPIQERHDEDPLKNKTNEPLYGFELGQFSTGDNIKYWIEANDTANNTNKSEEKLIQIGTR